MHIKIISVGKIKERYFVDAINEYSKRLSAYCDLEMIEVQDESISKNSNDSLDKIIKEKEGERILTKIKPGEYIILLDFEKSKEYDSISFSKHIEDLMCSSQSRITFIIGGSLGLGENIRKVANERMLLSKMTFTHQMTTVILLEQIYRAFKIMNHETYHK
ncbi:MAG: 23S rRNA (pseudouridine(1915)-N(3))-methyltransferase RlmH [Erysipelotrichaceae bacterium]|nr:23S rRNA (pseudouridine(1915)-N(3))-methyltransferase RlmH [Erysipelotrichaceae bacterium]